MSERSGSPCVPTVRVTEPNPVPSRLGVFRSGDGLDVSVVARGAPGVDMCIFDEVGAETRYALIGPHTGIWHGHIPGCLLYTSRAHTSTPCTKAVPRSGVSRPVAMVSVVVLPAPFGPTIP